MSSTAKVRLCSIVLMLALLAGCAAKQTTTTTSAAPHKVAVGESAPLWTLKDMDGKKVSLAQFRGKPVFMNAFATWCPPCKQELPGIVAAYPQYKDEIVFVGVDEQEDAELVLPFLKHFAITYQVVLDPGDIADSYSIRSLPESIFIDRNGVVRKTYRGYMTPAVLKENLASIL